jgi:hypothetical protein
MTTFTQRKAEKAMATMPCSTQVGLRNIAKNAGLSVETVSIFLCSSEEKGTCREQSLFRKLRTPCPMETNWLEEPGLLPVSLLSQRCSFRVSISFDFSFFSKIVLF